MGQEILKKSLFLLGFIIMGLISCWATEHSFHLLIQWMPEPFVWGLTIAFFIIASLGTKLVVDSFADTWMENRRQRFWFGIVLVVIFWLCMSMPTNTHTFFYNHKVGAVVQEDLTETSNYLGQIKQRVNVDSAYNSLHDKVQLKFTELTDEYNGIGMTGRRGGGEIVRRLLREINQELERELPGSSVVFNDAAYNRFHPEILSSYERQMNNALEKIKDTNYRVALSAAEEAAEDMRKFALMADTVKKMVEAGSVHEDIITQANGVILSGYTCVKNNAKFVRFNNDTDAELYTAENLETRTKRMLSVIDVWLDFLGGKYPASFLFYVLVSILVDVAAFIFFDLAFKNRD